MRKQIRFPELKLMNVGEVDKYEEELNGKVGPGTVLQEESLKG